VQVADISTTLAQLPLLSGLGEEALTAIATAGTVIRLTAGDVLVRQGDIGDTLYLLLSGELRAQVNASTDEATYRAVASILPGEVVGELALLASIPRSADVVAVEESTLLMFDRVHALALLGAHPSFARRVMGQIAMRLAQTTAAPQFDWSPSRERVRVWQLKAGNEAMLRQALASVPAEAHDAFIGSGMRSVQIFQRDRTVVEIWTAMGKASDGPDPVAADADTLLMGAIRPLLEYPDEAQGPCALVYDWYASGIADV
jgi:CRP-like cAMP-binding protein